MTSYKTTLTLEGSDGSKLQLQAYAHKSPDLPCRATQCLAAPCQALPRPYLFSFRLPRAASRSISAMKDLEVNAPHRGRVKGSPRQATFVRLRARRGFPSIMKTVAILAVNAGVLQRGIVATALEHDKPAITCPPKKNALFRFHFSAGDLPNGPHFYWIVNRVISVNLQVFACQRLGSEQCVTTQLH